MKYIEFVKVDAGDGLPETQFPLRNGPADPLPGITIGWWMTAEDGVPHYYGSVANAADLDVPGVLSEITAEQWTQLVVTRRRAALDAVDSAAGVIRMQFVSAGQYIEQEYRLAQEEVAEWRAAGSKVDAAPDSVLSGAEYAGISVEEAALEIEQSAQAWTDALLQIRTLRLTGKRLLRDCAAEAITSTMQRTIDQLQALPAQIAVPAA